MCEPSSATLTGASMERVSAEGACLPGAELVARATKGQFQDVDAERACFEGAMLKNASFRAPNLPEPGRESQPDRCGSVRLISKVRISQVEFQRPADGLVLRLAEFEIAAF